MLGFPASTEFGKRIPKQKFYENLDVSPALRRVFVDQIRLVYWRNKLAASTLNIAAGEAVTEIEVFEVRLNDSQLDEAVLKQIDKEIPYHILFILTCDGKAQAWIGYKEAAASGSNAFKVSRYYHTDWMPEDELHLSIDGLNMADWAWRWSKELFDFGYENGFIVIKKYDGYSRIYTKTYQNCKIAKAASGFTIEYIQRTKAISTLEFVENEYSNDNSKKNLTSLFESSVFDYSKPTALLKTLVQYSSTADDIVMDFFSGSATTAHAVMRLNTEDGGHRSFIRCSCPSPAVRRARPPRRASRPSVRSAKPASAVPGIRSGPNSPVPVRTSASGSSGWTRAAGRRSSIPRRRYPSR